MALTSTLYNFSVQLSDIDRNVYETLELRIARHPSETAEYLLTRLLAYCLEYQEGVVLSEGIASTDEPAVMVRDLTGRITAWIEVGTPDPERLHRGSKLAGRAAVYIQRDPTQYLAQLAGHKVHRAAEIPIYSFGREFIPAVAAKLDRRCALSISVTERQIYLDVAGHNFSTTIEDHRFA
ncbi:YaeQ family protein [Stenotrophobium rhamnosiphilum]|uniref:YaeQ family protein n=1 Tax=Stenotrophobium rhamnosiphilum TaxID=2029166 RepID=A0A2T5MK48_9GAMM|nr:YaeQ family protein [Stenotrophobium rhamnosiphilum]PTU32945.1 hypothetical protein CJD38_02200 [Stenotrophobium rhamnosiphilum]